LHRDYLGSILTVTDNAGAIVEKRHFDAWGNVLLVQDGQNNNLSQLTFLERGYTGHEHLQGVGLINMNARLYDAKLHRFLAPDNYVQDATNPQNYNRYGYAWNNPLKHTDKSGYIIELVFGIGNVIAHHKRGESINFWKGLEYFAQGFLAGTLAGPNSVIEPQKDIFGFLAFWEGINGDWSSFKNVGKIYLGRFYLDENKTFVGAVLEGFNRFSEQEVQTSLGYTWSLIRNFYGDVDRVDYLGGATFVTNENNPNRKTGQGISLGNYLNNGIPGAIEGDFDIYVTQNSLYMHEYGHYVDSQMYGRGYMSIIGFPSAFGSEWTERRANREAYKYFKHNYNVKWRTQPWREGTILDYYPLD